MEYTVHKLGEIAGISPRTLRYYDEIGILKPARISSSGYRIYGRHEVDRLQQILFYRELGIGLEEIRDIVTDPAFNRKQALVDHRRKLLERKAQLDLLISNVDRTLAQEEGGTPMRDPEKFEGFKQKLVDENEKKYGTEVRHKYGEDAVNQSNRKVKNMTEEQYEALEKLSKDIMNTLAEAYKTGNPAGELAQKAADLHRQWLCFFWDAYSKEAHAGLGQMYVDDERFTAYYDKEQTGTAAFLRDAIMIYTGMKD